MNSLTESTLRVFCAIEVPDDLRARVAGHLDQLRRSFPGVPIRWERAEKLHLTLKFFGGVEAVRIGALEEALRIAARSTPAFALTIAGTGAFPGRGAPRVLWLGVTEASGELGRLHERAERECAARGFPPERRAFHPHLTLARLDRTPASEARRLAQLHSQAEFTAEFAVDHVALVKSELRPSGSIHTVLSRHPLRSL